MCRVRFPQTLGARQRIHSILRSLQQQHWHLVARIAAKPLRTLFKSMPNRCRIHQNEGSIRGHATIFAVRSDTPIRSATNQYDRPISPGPAHSAAIASNPGRRVRLWISVVPPRDWPYPNTSLP